MVYRIEKAVRFVWTGVYEMRVDPRSVRRDKDKYGSVFGLTKIFVVFSSTKYGNKFQVINK